MKIIRTRRDILCGQRLPRFYGFAYYDFERAIEVAYPLGINKIVGWWRRFMDYMRAPPSMSKDRELVISLDNANKQIVRMYEERAGFEYDTLMLKSEIADLKQEIANGNKAHKGLILEIESLERRLDACSETSE